MKDKKRILVTGGTGFVGSSIIAEIQNAEKFELSVMSRKAPENSNSKSSVKIFETDISDYKTLKKLEKLEKIDVLIHTAGLAHQFGKTRKEDFWRTNVLGTENICRLAGILKAVHLILISSVSVYGNHGEVEIDESFKCEPVGFYAESKLEAERTAIEWCEKSGIGLTILRLGTVIGEGDVGNVARLITQIDKNRFFWIGNGKNKKSLIYKKDVGKAVQRLLQAKKMLGTEIYNLTSIAISMKEIVGQISENLKKSILPLKMPEQFIRKIFQINEQTLSIGFLKKNEKTITKWLSNDIFSGENLYKNYGFKAQTPISEAIKRQVADYLKQKNKKRT